MAILILGATSSIAKATAAEFAAHGHDLVLASRDVEELNNIAQDLRIRFRIEVFVISFDVEDFSGHAVFWQSVLSKVAIVKGVLVAIGYLGDQHAARQSKTAQHIINCNFTGIVSILSFCADYFEQQKSGFIIGLSSVAGERGRQSNYVYGAAKGAFSIYLQGLRNRLHSANVKVITAKLGFVDTQMTYGLPGLFAVADPVYVAKRVVASLNSSRDVIYLPWFWHFIMLIIKAIPESLFKRLSL